MRVSFLPAGLEQLRPAVSLPDEKLAAGGHSLRRATMIPGRHLAHRRNASYALVITLLGVVLLTIVVVAFTQTMTLSVNAAKSYADIRRETLAAQAGLDTALAQMTLATGTNLAFVTGLTSTNTPFPNTPVTVIGEGDLTNFDQMMPMVSGPVENLSNFGTAGWGSSFTNYTAALAAGSAAQTVDVNVYTNNTSAPYPFIQQTNSANAYRATWVTLTNMVGNVPSYTRFAYVVLDDAARVNPALMPGTGTGFTNTTNWYAGPQDISLTNAGAPLMNAGQIAQITAATNSFAQSDSTLGETFVSRSQYEAVKHLFTSSTNSSFDVIPAGMADAGKPKYNINDLATNTLYGVDAMTRSANIATIIERNLPNFYKRDTALSAKNTTLYVGRLAANIADYISPDGTFVATDYSTNSTGISPQGHGIYPIDVFEQIYAVSGGTGTTAHSSSVISTQFWLECWNPYTTPITIKSASLRVFNRPGYTLGSGPLQSIADYSSGVSIISDSEGSAANQVVVAPNEFVVLGFAPVQYTILGTSTTSGPSSETQDGPTDVEQFSLTVNGQTVAQTGAQNANAPLNAPNSSGGLQHESQGITTTNCWEGDSFSSIGTGVGDPRFISYYNQEWNNVHDVGTAYTSGASSGGPSFWKGRTLSGGSQTWAVIPAPTQASTWGSRDNMPRGTLVAGNAPINDTETPDQVPSAYNQATDSNAAPEVMKNAPMVSVGELGHILDPAYANDNLTSTLPTSTIDSYYSAYQNGGGRSLRIGRPEANGSGVGGGSATAASWDVDGERGIDLLDLFTINNTNAATSATQVNYTNLVTGGAQGRVNINTASTNVLAAVLSGITIDSDSGMGGNRTLANVAGIAANMVANRPYSKLSDLYKAMPMFDATTNYTPAFALNTSGFLNVFNRVHQEAFGKLVQHLTVQSRSYRVYVIGQLLDKAQNPKGSIVMEANVYLQFDTTAQKYEPVVQSVHILNQ